MIVKKIDSVGRVVIPVEIRTTLNWKEGEQLLLEIKDDSLVIKKKEEQKCKLCGSQEGLIKINNNWLCENCVAEIHNIL